MATSSDGGVEGRRGGADRGEDPAPVGVPAEDGALEQVVAGDRAGDLDARRRSVAAWTHLDRDVVVGALGVARSAAGPGRAQTAVTASANSSGPGATPQAPLAISSTVSLVDMQPSESIRSKVVAVAARSAASQRGRVDDGVGGEHDEHGRQRRREHAGALGHAADDPAVAGLHEDLLADRVGGHDRVGRVGAAVGRQGSGGRGDTGGSRSIGSSSPISPVEQTTTSPAEIASTSATCSAVAWVSAKPCGAGVAVGAAGVQDDGVDPRRRRWTWRLQATGAALHPVAGEDGRGAVVGPVVDDEGDVGRPRA